MSNDVNGMNLREPDQMNWNDFNPSGNGKYQAPPDALDAAGKPIVYTAILPSDLGNQERLTVTKDGYRAFNVGPLKFVKNTNGADGYEIRFYTVSTKKFQKQDGTPIEVNSVGKLIRAAGIAAKPQRNVEYEAAVKAASGRVVPLTIDWEAYNKDTGEEVKGFLNFPLDPATGKRKAILRQGDVLVDGNVVKSEILFARARVRNVQDPNRK